MIYQTGLIKIIVIIIILIGILSYFGISVKSIVENDVFQKNIDYVLNWVKYIWNTYLVGPARYLWNDIFIDLLWNSFIENMQRIKEGRNLEIIENAPRVDFDTTTLPK
jgi:hypothetical protein